MACFSSLLTSVRCFQSCQLFLKHPSLNVPFHQASVINWSMHNTAWKFFYERTANSHYLSVTSKIHPCGVIHTRLHDSPRPVLFIPFLSFLCCFPSCWPATSFGDWLQRAHLMANLHILLYSFFDTSILFLCCLNLCIPHLKWSHFSVIILKRKYVMLLFSLKFPLMGCHAGCSPHVANLMNLLCVCLFVTRRVLQYLFKYSCVLMWKPEKGLFHL